MLIYYQRFIELINIGSGNDLLSEGTTCGIHFWAISQEMLRISVLDMSLKITDLKFCCLTNVLCNLLWHWVSIGSDIWIWHWWQAVTWISDNKVLLLHQAALRPSDAIWRHRSGSTLAQVMAWCLTAPSHYLNQCWLIVNGILWYSPCNNFTGSTWDISSWVWKLWFWNYGHISQVAMS